MTFRLLSLIAILLTMSSALPLSKNPTIVQSQRDQQYKVNTNADGLATTTVYTMLEKVDEYVTNEKETNIPLQTPVSENENVNGKYTDATYPYVVYHQEEEDRNGYTYDNKEAGGDYYFDFTTEYDNDYEISDSYYDDNFDYGNDNPDSSTLDDDAITAGENDNEEKKDEGLHFIDGIIWFTSS